MPDKANSFGWTRAELGQISCTLQTIGRGYRMIVAFSDLAIDHPIGFVWGDLLSKGNFENELWVTLGSYVLPPYRRLGVRTAIDEAIPKLTGVTKIRTSYGSEDDGGLAYLIASGYKRDDGAQCWWKKVGAQPAKRKKR